MEEDPYSAATTRNNCHKQPLSGSSRLAQRSHLISPPPAFRSSEPALNRLAELRSSAGDSYPGGAFGAGARAQQVTGPCKSRSGSGSGSVLAGQRDAADPQAEKRARAAASAASQTNLLDTELTTRLTRTKRAPQSTENTKERLHSSERTRATTFTKLEQDLVAPEAGGPANQVGSCSLNQQAADLSKMCRFKAQVLFESDTDSMAERQSAASSRSGAQSHSSSRGIGTGTGAGAGTGTASATATDKLPRVAGRHKKELVSETSYTRSGPLNQALNQAQVGRLLEQQARQVGGGAQFKFGTANNKSAKANAAMSQPHAPLMPSWDYSLRVNRMRGNKVDSKVK